GFAALALRYSAGLLGRLDRWAGVLCVPLAGLAVKATLTHETVALPAVTLGLACATVWALARARGEEAWALVAALGGHRPAALPVRNLFRSEPRADCGVWLFQATAAAGAVMALAWQGLGGRWRTRPAPFWRVPLAGAVVAQALVLALTLPGLLADPGAAAG